MATIDIRKSHGLDRDEAVRRTRTLLVDFAEKRPELFKDIRWAADGSRADVTGTGFKGRFEVTASEVVVAIDLALLARPFKSKIEDSLAKRLQSEFGG